MQAVELTAQTSLDFRMIPVETPWVRARKNRSLRQEERNGNLPGGSKQVNSGRIWRFKRDNKLYNFLIESRTTEADSYRVNRKEFLDIEKEGFQTPPGMLPGIQVDIKELQLIVIRLTAFQGLQETIIDQEAEIVQLKQALAKLHVQGV